MLTSRSRYSKLNRSPTPFSYQTVLGFAKAVPTAQKHREAPALPKKTLCSV